MLIDREFISNAHAYLQTRRKKQQINKWINNNNNKNNNLRRRLRFNRRIRFFRHLARIVDSTKMRDLEEW